MARSNYATTGMSILWFALALDGLGVILEWYHRSRGGFALASIPILLVVGFVLWWFVTTQVAEARTWARIVYIVLTAVKVLSLIGISLVPGLATMVFSLEGTGGTLEIAELILQAIGIALIFSAPAIRR